MIKKIKTMVYLTLKDEGRQSHLNDIVEYIISSVILLNVIFIVAESVDEIRIKYSLIINILRMSFFVFFLTEYILRVWISDIVLHDKNHPVFSRIRYMLTFKGIIDLLALLPVLLGKTIIDFRIFRVLRLFRITQLKWLRRYTEIVSSVIKLKGTQLLSSLAIVFIFMLASSVLINDLEHAAQPTVFKNILVGLWWSISAITTVGYGDIYPITPLGRTFASLISIFGVFIMAIPIGILSAGFFEISKAFDSTADSNENLENKSHRHK